MDINGLYAFYFIFHLAVWIITIVLSKAEAFVLNEYMHVREAKSEKHVCKHLKETSWTIIKQIMNVSNLVTKISISDPSKSLINFYHE